jgi:Cu/Ag efflux protein CusF
VLFLTLILFRFIIPKGTEGNIMKVAKSVVVIALVLLAFAGVALAMEQSGVVKAVDVQKGMLTLTSGTVDVGFDCELGSLIKDVKVGDKVTVEYTEKGGKKVVTKVGPQKAKAQVGC